MYPIKFENLYYDKVWGGRDLEEFRSNLPEGNIGESWDIACHENGTGIVANGRFKGMSFKELIENYKEEIFGESVKEEFPLLVKLINSNENLSVQVHPNDEYAARVENSYGKTEAWYVVDAKEGAELIVGTNGCTKEEFEAAIKSGNVEDYLNIVYDYGRPREIHVEKSLEVIDFDLKPERLVEDYKVFDGYKYTSLCKSEYFTIDKCVIDFKYNTSSNKNMFSIITCVDGKGIINYKGGTEVISKGDSILIPAQLGDYEIKGDLEILISNPII